MTTFFLFEGDFSGIFYFIFMILLGPPLLLSLIGLLFYRTTSRKAGKILFILAGIYLVVGLGICGALMVGF